ncbi:hypothetical protein M3Y99_01183100 [Aphelenchoides fujianensis]|nr:hypothetical protein M3Y99_01183100 [Aphelenchoides fujianensis]
MLTIKPRMCTRLPCVLLAVVLLVVFVLVFVSEPTEIDHYLPTHALSNIKMHRAETFDVLRRKLQRAHPQRVFRQPVKHVYPRRKNMEECRPLFGRVGVFVAVNSDHDKRLYKIAQASLKCYLKSTNYSYFYVDVDKDERTRGLCNQSNIQILKAALPNAVAEIKACDAIYHRAKTLEQYYDYVTCCKLQLGAARVFPGSVRIYRRAHGWARDGQLTGNHWMHAWKASELNSTWFDANVFEEIPDPAECGDGLSGWKWLEEKKTTVQKNRERLAAFEKGVAKGYPKEGRDIPHLIEPDVRECYPDCDRFT